MKTWAEVGQLVKKRRAELGLTQKQVVVAAGEGLSVPNLQVIEGGRATGVKQRTKLALARALKWPPPALDWLAEGDDPSWWDGEPFENGVRWTRCVPGDPDAPMVVTEVRNVRDFQDFLVMPGEIGPVIEGVAAQPGRMALERAKEAHEEVIRLKVHLEALAGRLDGHDRQLAALAAVPEKLDQVLDALTGRAEAVAGSLPLGRPAQPAPRARKRRPPAAEGGGPGP